MDQLPSKPSSYAKIIREILTSVNGPIAIEELAARVLQTHPSSAKNPRLAAIAKIRESLGLELVYYDENSVLPLHLAFRGARYRIRIDQENIDESAVTLLDNFYQYLPIRFSIENIRMVDFRGVPIPFEIVKIPYTVVFLGEVFEDHNPVVVLKEWFQSQAFDPKDHILVTIEDWERGVFRLEREPFSAQHPDLIAERNLYIANEMYKMLESARFDSVNKNILVPTIFARMPDKNGYPPDQWRIIVESDPRMVEDGWSIRYSDDNLLQWKKLSSKDTGQSLTSKAQENNQENAKQVYRFRAFLTQNPSIWREFEIRGKQSLVKLDNILRITFQHDTSDHLSGFWKMVARTGRSRKRFREVELVTINPFEDEEGADTSIASLNLAVGDKMKYVYDFGDWIEHKLELLAIHEAEKGVRYPRETARNKPEHKFCTDCLKKGKKTVALWICHTCSYHEQQDVLLCDDCFDQHEGDNAEEIIY